MLKIKSLLQKVKYIIILIILFTIITNSITFAIESSDDNLKIDEINSLVEDVEANIKKTPIINSRHAVVYERTSRKNIIWKKRKRKVQNGIYHKNHDSE